jgi:hypothetical protein
LTEAKLILSWLGGFSLYFSLGVEGWLWIGWVVGFTWSECFLLFVVVGARNELISTLLTLMLTSLKPNTQFVCGFGCTLLNLTQMFHTEGIKQARRMIKFVMEIFNLND